MMPTSVMLSSVHSMLAALLLAGAVAAQPAPPASPGGLGRVFSAALDALGLVFKGIGSLAGGPTAGAIWRVDIRTGQRQRIGTADGLAWPVASADGTVVYALRARQVVRMLVSDGRETPVGAPADWRKLVGVLPDGTVLGFIEDDPRPHAALLTPGGKLTELPSPVDDVERRRNGALLQEGRDYKDGTRLEVRDSERGGRGSDVFLVSSAGAHNLSDCGDDHCGQPSRSLDGLAFFYVRQPNQ
jgi:hypothetical protein